MPCCSILSCRNESGTKNVSNGGVSYHRYPKDVHLKEKWIEATGRENWVPVVHNTICSDHFQEKYLFKTKKGYRYLMKSAIPTKNIVCSLKTENSLVAGSSPGGSSERSQSCAECENQIQSNMRLVCLQCTECVICVECACTSVHRDHYVLRAPEGRAKAELEKVIQDFKNTLIEVNKTHELLTDIEQENVKENQSTAEPVREKHFQLEVNDQEYNIFVKLEEAEADTSDTGDEEDIISVSEEVNTGASFTEKLLRMEKCNSAVLEMSNIKTEPEDIRTVIDDKLPADICNREQKDDHTRIDDDIQTSAIKTEPESEIDETQRAVDFLCKDQNIDADDFQVFTHQNKRRRLSQNSEYDDTLIDKPRLDHDPIS